MSLVVRTISVTNAIGLFAIAYLAEGQRELVREMFGALDGGVLLWLWGCPFALMCIVVLRSLRRGKSSNKIRSLLIDGTFVVGSVFAPLFVILLVGVLRMSFT